MQTRLTRLAAEKWHKSLAEAVTGKVRVAE